MKLKKIIITLIVVLFSITLIEARTNKRRRNIYRKFQKRERNLLEKKVKLEIEVQGRFNDYSSNGLNDASADFSVGGLIQQSFINSVFIKKYSFLSKMPFHFLSGLEFQYFGPTNEYAKLKFIQIGAVGSFDFSKNIILYKIHPAFRIKSGVSIDQFIPSVDRFELQTENHLYMALSTGVGMKLYKHMRIHFFNEVTWNFFSDKTIRIWSLTLAMSYIL